MDRQGRMEKKNKIKTLGKARYENIDPPYINKVITCVKGGECNIKLSAKRTSVVAFKEKYPIRRRFLIKKCKSNYEFKLSMGIDIGSNK